MYSGVGWINSINHHMLGLRYHLNVLGVGSSRDRVEI